MALVLVSGEEGQTHCWRHRSRERQRSRRKKAGRPTTYWKPVLHYAWPYPATLDDHEGRIMIIENGKALYISAQWQSIPAMRTHRTQKIWILNAGVDSRPIAEHRQVQRDWKHDCLNRRRRLEFLLYGLARVSEAFLIKRIVHLSCKDQMHSFCLAGQRYERCGTRK